MKAKITLRLQATAKDIHEIKGHATIAWNPFFTSVHSSHYPNYPLIVSRNTFKNRDRDELITICLCVEDAEAL